MGMALAAAWHSLLLAIAMAMTVPSYGYGFGNSYENDEAYVLPSLSLVLNIDMATA